MMGPIADEWDGELHAFVDEAAGARLRGQEAQALCGMWSGDSYLVTGVNDKPRCAQCETALFILTNAGWKGILDV